MEKGPDFRRLGQIPEAEKVDLNESPVTRQEMKEALRDALQGDEKPRKKLRTLKEKKSSKTTTSTSESEDVIQALHGDEGSVPEQQIHVKFEESRKELPED